VHPRLLTVGDWVLPTYLTMISVGATLAVFAWAREIRRSDLPLRPTMRLALVFFPSAMIGAWLWHVLWEAPERYAADPLLAFSPQAGWTWYGGFLGGFAGAWLACRAKGLPFAKVADTLAPVVPLGHAFGRLGCLAAGCCYGQATDLPWGVRFYHAGALPVELMGVSLHPVQLYESVALVGLFAWLSRVRSPFAGGRAAMLIAAYAPIRFGMEFFRADAIRGAVGPLSSSQALAVVLFALSAAFVWWRRAIP